MKHVRVMYAKYLNCDGRTKLVPNQTYRITIVDEEEEEYSALIVNVLIQHNEYPTRYFVIYYADYDTLYTQWAPMEVVNDFKNF